MSPSSRPDVSHLERGTGQALVLLHGISSAARSWKHQIASLSDRFRVIAWNAPGYGDSAPLPLERPRPEHYAARLAEWLDALRLERLHLVGHSLGAIIAVRFAVEHADRILSLTLASPSSGQAHLPELERERLRKGRLDDLETLGPRGMAQKRAPRLVSAGAPEEARRTVIETMAAVNVAGYRQAVEMLAAADTKIDIERLSSAVSVRFIYGDADVVTTPESIRRLAAARPQAPVRVISGAGHAVYLENPSEFNAALVRDLPAIAP